MDAIGLIELSSIAKGIEAADTALKTSDIQLISSFAGCPGKYYFLFSGRTAAVQEALSASLTVGKGAVVDSTMISNIQPEVIAAMTKSTPVPLRKALGVMEFFSVTAAIYASDAAAKTADVSLIELRCGLGIGGKSYVTMTGDVAAVHAAVNFAISHEAVQGMTVGTAVIPNPDPKLFDALL